MRDCSQRRFVPTVDTTRDDGTFLIDRNGIFSDTTCDNKNPMAVNHALVIVGYGQERGIPYWLMRNSWSNR